MCADHAMDVLLVATIVNFIVFFTAIVFSMENIWYYLYCSHVFYMLTPKSGDQNVLYGRRAVTRHCVGVSVRACVFCVCVYAAALYTHAGTKSAAGAGNKTREGGGGNQHSHTSPYKLLNYIYMHILHVFVTVCVCLRCF